MQALLDPAVALAAIIVIASTSVALTAAACVTRPYDLQVVLVRILQRTRRVPWPVLDNKPDMIESLVWAAGRIAGMAVRNAGCDTDEMACKHMSMFAVA